MFPLDRSHGRSSPDSCRNPLEELGRYNRFKVCHRIKWVSCSAVRVYMQQPTCGSYWHWDIEMRLFLACRNTLVLMVEMEWLHFKNNDVSWEGESASSEHSGFVSPAWCWTFGATWFRKQDLSLKGLKSCMFPTQRQSILVGQPYRWMENLKL